MNSTVDTRDPVAGEVNDTEAERTAQSLPLAIEQPLDSPKRRSFVLGKPRIWSSIVVVLLAAVTATAILLTTGGASDVALPDGFPSAEQLPLADGTRIAANDSAGAQLSATVQVADHAAQQQAIEKLRESGYAVTGATGSGPVGTVTSLANDSYTARVSFEHSKDAGYTVHYEIAGR